MGAFDELETAQRTGECPECAHPATAGIVIEFPWLRRLFRRPDPVPKPLCQASDGGDNPSGWPGVCGCRHAFHAS